jgi:hypothetical protein
VLTISCRVGAGQLGCGGSGNGDAPPHHQLSLSVTLTKLIYAGLVGAPAGPKASPRARWKTSSLAAPTRDRHRQHIQEMLAPIIAYASPEWNPLPGRKPPRNCHCLNGYITRDLPDHHVFTWITALSSSTYIGRKSDYFAMFTKLGCARPCQSGN